MCGRFSLTAEIQEFLNRFSLKPSDIGLKPRYNIAPSQKVPVIMPGKKLKELIWGLKPSWAKSDFKPLINARGETLLEKPSFKEAFRSRRCLIPATGFYEWHKKVPCYFTLKDNPLFAFAGIWENDTAAIITTEPNELVSPVHNRMPVILARDSEDSWLAPDFNPSL